MTDDRITLYGSPTCPQVAPVRAMLRRTGVEYDYVSITFDNEARETVKGINDGHASVPTVVFPDGDSLTEPSDGALQVKLEALGYHVPPATALEQFVIAMKHPALGIFGVVALVIGLTTGGVWLMSSGLVITIVVLFAHVLDRVVLR